MRVLEKIWPIRRIGRWKERWSLYWSDFAVSWGGSILVAELLWPQVVRTVRDLLGYDTVQSGRWVSKFWRHMLDFRQKVQAFFFSDTLLPSYQSVRYRNPADHSYTCNSYSEVRHPRCVIQIS